MHLVVAEDEPLIRLMVTDLLTESGFLVREAKDAEGALSILSSDASDIHVLFTDVRMPGAMDGLALTHHVKVNWPWIGLLIASAHAQPSATEMPEGCRFIAKPYQTAHLLALVTELAENRSGKC